MMPVDTCGEDVYICRDCCVVKHPDREWIAACRNDACRKACWFCGSNLGDMDMVPRPLSSAEGGSNA